jgi:hypothetical protein
MNNVFPLISLGNEAPVLAAGSALAGGQYALANESRLGSATFSQPLTEYIVGWKDSENIQATLDYIAPPVPVARRFDWKKADNSQAFLSEIDDERAIGSGFKRVEYSGTSALGKTKNRGLTYCLDRDEDGGATTEEVITGRLVARIMRNKLRRAITALLALDATGTAKTWDGSSKPNEDIRTALAAAQLASGVFPNRAIIGLVAWNLRAAAYAGQNNAGAYAGINQTPMQVAQGLGLDDMLISRELYQVSNTAKARIMTSNVVLFNATVGVGKDDPSHLKQFYTAIGGGRWAVHREEKGPKFVEITVEHYDDIVATSTLGAAKLNIS